MRLIVLQILGGIAALVYLAMLAAIARHRLQSDPQTTRSPALAEYLWATIPWLMIISAAIPAVRQIGASACQSCAAPPVAAVLAPESHAFLSKTAVVIDKQQREQRQ